MSHRHSLTPPAVLVETRNSNDTCVNSCWSGYLTKSSSSTAYNWAEGIYNEPQALSTTCSNNSESTWSGLGGYGTSTVAQDGTSINSPTLGQHQSWYQIYPGYAVAEPVYGHPGYAFTAEVNHPGNGVFNFNLYDSYSGYGIQFQVASSLYDGSSAEFIVEPPQVNGARRTLTNYAHINFLDVWVNGNGSGHGIGSYSPQNLYSYGNNGDLLASNGSLFNGGQSFKNNFNACS